MLDYGDLNHKEKMVLEAIIDASIGAGREMASCETVFRAISRSLTKVQVSGYHSALTRKGWIEKKALAPLENYVFLKPMALSALGLVGRNWAPIGRHIE